MHLLTPLLLLSILFVPIAATASMAAETGAIVLIGGVLRYDNRAVWERIIELAGGQGAKFVVFPPATGRPQIYGRFAVRALHKYGALAELIPVSPEADSIGIDYRQAVQDEALLNKVRDADGIFFTGGAPQHIAQTLYHPDGAPSPMLTAIWKVYIEGGVIAGANVGHTVVSTGTSANTVLQTGLPEQAMQRGLGLLSDNWFIDQHYFTHGRFVVGLVAMKKRLIKQGIGVGINTAVTIIDGKQAEVVGTGGAMIIDLSQAHLKENEQFFSLKQGKLSYLGNGDKFDLHTRRITPHDSKLQGVEVDPNAVNFQPWLEKALFYADLFAHSALPNLMFSALDSEQQQGVGLVCTEHFPGSEFRFYTGKDSFGWISNVDDYTATNIYLDVTPINPGQDTRCSTADYAPPAITGGE